MFSENTEGSISLATGFIDDKLFCLRDLIKPFASSCRERSLGVF